MATITKSKVERLLASGKYLTLPGLMTGFQFCKSDVTRFCRSGKLKRINVEGLLPDWRVRFIYSRASAKQAKRGRDSRRPPHEVVTPKWMVSPQRASEMFDVHPTTLTRAFQEGKIDDGKEVPCARSNSGKAIRLDRESVRKFVAGLRADLRPYDHPVYGRMLPPAMAADFTGYSAVHLYNCATGRLTVPGGGDLHHVQRTDLNGKPMYYAETSLTGIRDHRARTYSAMTARTPAGRLLRYTRPSAVGQRGPKPFTDPQHGKMLPHRLAAERLGVSRPTLDRMIGAGQIKAHPATWRGQQVGYFAEVELDAYLRKPVAPAPANGPLATTPAPAAAAPKAKSNRRGRHGFNEDKAEEYRSLWAAWIQAKGAGVKQPQFCVEAGKTLAYLRKAYAWLRLHKEIET